MCFVLAKHKDRVGCVALQTTRGQHVVDLKRAIINVVGYDNIQLVTISRPSAYGEYEPYHFVNTEQEFMDAAIAMNQTSI